MSDRIEIQSTDGRYIGWIAMQHVIMVSAATLRIESDGVTHASAILLSDGHFLYVAESPEQVGSGSLVTQLNPYVEQQIVRPQQEKLFEKWSPYA